MKRISYGVLALSIMTAISLPGQTFTTVHNFNSPKGSEPYAGLVQGIDGNLYGTTSYRGDHCDPLGCGTIFKITPAGAFTTLYDFCPVQGCADGKRPIMAMSMVVGHFRLSTDT
jgi:uncharacterized repeat protein (TIGR03803 family)